jgi:hypothetical protein
MLQTARKQSRNLKQKHQEFVAKAKAEAESKRLQGQVLLIREEKLPEG